MDTSTLISWWQALVLGVVEGITEYLPISSTGHLVITSDLIGLRDHGQLTAAQIEAVQAFEIVIQGGAILAVLSLYRHYVFEIIRGLFGKSAMGRRLLINISCATVPVLALGFGLKGVIAQHLQFTGPVLFALVLGGIAMLAFERSYKSNDEARSFLDIQQLTWRQALVIGSLQCLALWPGTSRSMVTIIGGMLVGLKRPAAAEFSFLIGLPALLAATLYKGYKDGNVLISQIGPSALAIGFVSATLFAALAVKWLVAFLNRRGLEVFGWYRIALAGLLFLVMGH